MDHLHQVSFSQIHRTIQDTTYEEVTYLMALSQGNPSKLKMQRLSSY